MTDQVSSQEQASPSTDPSGLGLSTADRDTTAWFVEHYEDAAGQVVDFLAGDGISMTGADVADIGCGDGIIDLGVAHKAQPRSLVGFDIVPTDTDQLLDRSRSEGVGTDLPACLEFRTCQPRSLPADDYSFDYVFTWSALEHVEDPVSVFREMARVLRPSGVVMLQIWPLYFSEHGAHLWQSLPDDRFVQLLQNQAQVEAEVRAVGKYPPEVTGEFLEVFATLNKVTIDDLQRAMAAAGLRVAKLEIQSDSVHIPPQLARRSLSQLGISGVKLLAVHG